MPKQIDKNKLKIKHLLGVQGENYPTEEDFLYEVICVLQEIDHLNNKFSKSHIIKQIKSRITSSGRLVDSLALLSERGYFEMENYPSKPQFKLLYHPWE
jgi:hypothetical protein